MPNSHENAQKRRDYFREERARERARERQSERMGEEGRVCMCDSFTGTILQREIAERTSKTQEKKKGGNFTRTVSQRQVAERENKLDTGEDRMSQRMKRSQKIRTCCQSQSEANQKLVRTQEKLD